MCLLVIAWNVHPRYRLILAGNRDEFHHRPAVPLGWWSDRPEIAAGRDLDAGGTWLGAARNGRLGVVTNFRDATRVTPAGAPSRGLLAPQFLSSAAAPAQFLGALQASAGDYAGFNLLLADPESLVYFSNRVNEAPQALAPGIYGLSNDRLDEPWPKVVRTREGFAAAISGDRPDPGELFAILADRTVATSAEHADTDLPPDWQRAVSAPFVVHERYGTRCTTLVLVEHGQRTTLHERRFDAAGVQTGASRVEFDVEPRGPARSAGPLRLPEETPELDTSTE